MVDYNCQSYHFLCFRDFGKQRQIQQPDKPVMSITVSPRPYPTKLGFSGQFHGMLVTLTALHDDVKKIKQQTCSDEWHSY